MKRDSSRWRVIKIKSWNLKASLKIPAPVFKRILKRGPGIWAVFSVVLIILAGCARPDNSDRQLGAIPSVKSTASVADVVAYTIMPSLPATPSPEPSPSLRPAINRENIQDVQTPTSLPPFTVTPSPLPTLKAANVITPTATMPVSPIATPVINTPAISAIIREETLSIPTYAYQQALSTSANFPYPLLDKSQMGPVQAKTYQTIILENEALQLTLLPALGGRLYQITHKATNQAMLYTNPVIKPTRWGPEEMSWWLAAGGMEWAFPVKEHGYAWAMPWDAATQITVDGSATASLTFQDLVTGLVANVVVVLAPTEATFLTIFTLNNPTNAPIEAQFWNNTALLAGPGMGVDLPATTVEVHTAGNAEGLSIGEVIPWQAEMASWGRWESWFSVFAAPVTDGTVKVWGANNSLALRRNFNPEQAPGLKLFIWGYDAPTYEFEGDPYFELWGGITPNFETFFTLEPGQKYQWTESWTVE